MTYLPHIIVGWFARLQRLGEMMRIDLERSVMIDCRVCVCVVVICWLGLPVVP